MNKLTLNLTISEDGKDYEYNHVGNDYAEMTAWLLYLDVNKRKDKAEREGLISMLEDVMRLPSGIKNPNEMADALVKYTFANDPIASLIFALAMNSK